MVLNGFLMEPLLLSSPEGETYKFVAALACTATAINADANTILLTTEAEYFILYPKQRSWGYLTSINLQASPNETIWNHIKK